MKSIYILLYSFFKFSDYVDAYVDSEFKIDKFTLYLFINIIINIIKISFIGLV